ncbi:hypothetical protein MOKP118_41830 [Mycobacterium avium subsp. hominissuis]
MYESTIAHGGTSPHPTPSRGDRILAVMRSYPEPTTLDDHIAYAHALADLGVHVAVIHKFGEKLPLDLRTDEMREADAAAGRTKRGWYLATTDKARLTYYITEGWRRTGGGLVNLGAHLAPSRLVVVDCDNEGDTIEWMRAAYDRREPEFATVMTPGKIVDGAWIHRDGTHIFYTVPEHVDPSTLRDISESDVPADEARGGWAVKASLGTGVVLPPSIRHEGRYTVARLAQIIDLPETLRVMITKPAPVIRDVGDDDEDVIEFRESVEDAMHGVPWSEVLEGIAYPDGIETCGCEIWTRYGGSRKSFVAHTDCPTLGGRTCLVVHSDNVPNHDIFVELARDRGGKAFSKWEAIAALHFDGDMAAVARHYGFSRPSANRGFTWTSLIEPDDSTTPRLGASLDAPVRSTASHDPTRCPHGGDRDSCVPCLSQRIADLTNGGVK